MLRRLLCIFFLTVGASSLRAIDTPVVVILANSDDPDSLKIARHYAQARSLPEDNIIALPLPLSEQISWTQYITTLHRPLVDELVKRSWIDAIPMDLEDDVGRRKLAVSHVHIRAMVVCRGVPLKIANDPVLGEKTAGDKALPGNFQTNAAAVDAELTLLAAGDLPINGFVPNPLFASTDPDALTRARIIPVGRLDGPTPGDAMALVDNALRAEREGLFGRAYIDIGGPFKQGNDWLTEVGERLAEIGFAPDIDTAKAIMPPSARFDAPVFYFGWYSGSIKGPMADPGFRFPAGAVALHIHSFSASTLRNGNGPWVPGLVARGVTLTCGNVNEPYLQFTHQPQRLINALIEGRPAGVAALESLTVLGWQAILVGDPLYQPFKVSFDAQWAQLDSLSPSQRAYLYLRKINLLDAAGSAIRANSQTWAALRKSPSLPIVMELARRQLATKDKRGARQTLAIIAGLPEWRERDAGLIAAGARLLVAAEEPDMAIKWYRRLLEDASLNRDVRISLLKEATDTARTGLDFVQSARWESELNTLTGKPGS